MKFLIAGGFVIYWDEFLTVGADIISHTWVSNMAPGPRSLGGSKKKHEVINHIYKYTSERYGEIGGASGKANWLSGEGYSSIGSRQ